MIRSRSIEGPKRAEKATNEDVKKLEQEGTKVGDLINLSGNCGMNYQGEPSAPPCDEPKQPADLSEVQPPSYEEACNPTLQPKDSKLSSNFNSALPLSNTARGVILS